MSEYSPNDQFRLNRISHKRIMVIPGHINELTNYRLTDSFAASYTEYDSGEDMSTTYRLGVTTLNKVLLDETTETPEYSLREPIPPNYLPDDARNAFIVEGAGQLPLVTGVAIFNTLGVTIPKDIEPMTLEEWVACRLGVGNIDRLEDTRVKYFNGQYAGTIKLRELGLVK